MPLLPNEPTSVPSALKRSTRFVPTATSKVLSGVTAIAPTDVISPGRVPAAPTSRRNVPSGEKTCTTLEDWSPT